MPQIKEYTSQVDRLRPDERGTDARLQEARRTGAFYNQAGEAISGAARAQADAAGDVAKSAAGVADAFATLGQQQETYAGNRAVAKGSAEGTQGVSNLNDAWNKTLKEASDRDPNDPTVATKFREEQLEPWLQKFQEAYSGTDHGRQWSEAFVARTRQHFFETTSAGMSSLAKVAVEANVEKLSNASSNVAFKSGDTHTTDFLLGNVKDSVGAIVASSNVKGVEAAKVQLELTQKMSEKLVKSGAIGAIAKSSDPERTAQEWADKYPELLSGTDAKQLAANAREQVRSRHVDENYQRHNADLQQKKVSEATESDILKKVYSDDPAVMSQVSVRSIVNDDRLTNPTKEKLIRLVDREMKPESDAKISARTSLDLFARIALPDGDPRKLTSLDEVTQARIDGKLTKADYSDLRKEFTEARTPQGEMLSKDRADFLKRWAPMIDGGFTQTGMHSMLGTQKTYEFQTDARRQEEVLRKKGLDPHLVYDPRSEYFFGRMENVAKYRVSLQETNTYQATLKSMDKQRDNAPPSKNLTGEGNTVTSVSVPIDIPAGMSPAEAVKKFGSGKTVRLPDGRTKVLP